MRLVAKKIIAAMLRTTAVVPEMVDVMNNTPMISAVRIRVTRSIVPIF